MGGRSRSTQRRVAPARRGPALSRRWLAALLLLATLFTGLRLVHLLQEPPQASALVTDQVVLVGVAARPALTPTDRAVVGANLDGIQVGAVNVRPRYLGDCAAAGWAASAARKTAIMKGQRKGAARTSGRPLAT